MTRFVGKTENHSARLAGDNMDQLIDEAMKYVIRDRQFYENSIREDLLKKGNSIVSIHSTSLSCPLCIYFDPDWTMNDDDFKNLSSPLFRMRYDIK